MQRRAAHLRPVGPARRRALRSGLLRPGRLRWRWVALAAVVAALTLLVVGSRTGQCADAVEAAASTCTTSPSGAVRLLAALVGGSAVVVLLRRAFRAE